MAGGSGFEIFQIIGQNQARVKFFRKSLFGWGYFCFHILCSKFGPHPGGSYGVGGGLGGSGF